jgi:hypothetical protein
MANSNEKINFTVQGYLSVIIQASSCRAKSHHITRICKKEYLWLQRGHILYELDQKPINYFNNEESDMRFYLLPTSPFIVPILQPN